MRGIDGCLKTRRCLWCLVCLVHPSEVGEFAACVVIRTFAPSLFAPAHRCQLSKQQHTLSPNTAQLTPLQYLQFPHCSVTSASYSPTMLLPFRDLKQQKFTIEAEPSETIGAVKRKISAEKGWDPSTQKLIYSGKILQDDNTIESYKIEEKGFIVCMTSKVL